MKLASFIKSGYIDQPFCVVLGNPVEQSMSPDIHNLAARKLELPWTYYKVEVTDEELEEAAGLFQLKNFVGANITIPHKRAIMQYVDIVKKSAEAINAVNTIVRSAGIITGYNTDEHGFSQPLNPCGDRIKHGTAMVFGTGGASSAVIYALNHSCAVDKIYVVTRDLTDKNMPSDPLFLIDYSMIPDYLDEVSIIINTTPVGMGELEDQSPMDSKLMPLVSNKICYDLIYNPLETRFLREASENGATTINGLPMFIHQAAEAFKLWTGQEFPVDEAANLVINELKKTVGK
jgi:shikimate dehydrogenase